MFGQASQAASSVTHPVPDLGPAACVTESDHARLRAPLRAVDLVLSNVAGEWLMSLPRPLRPAGLCVVYPRVVNRLALCWNDRALTDRLLDDLLIGRRGKRKGFPGPVAEELMRLRQFHDHGRAVEVETTPMWEYNSLAVSECDPSHDQQEPFLATISFSNRNAPRRTARRLVDAHSPSTVSQQASQVIAAAKEPPASGSSLDLMHGLQVSEEYMDTLPCDLVDEFFKR